MPKITNKIKSSGRKRSVKRIKGNGDYCKEIDINLNVTPPSNESQINNMLATSSSTQISSLWTLAPRVKPNHVDNSNEETDIVKEGKDKKHRRLTHLEREQEQQKLEASLREAEQLRLHRRLPQTEQDYNELLLSNSSCSETWIRYIGHLLEFGEPDRARAEARRALTVIPSEDQEARLNVWLVLLRLEVMYGNDANVTTVFRDASGNCDHYTVHCAMAGIYKDQSMMEKAESVYRGLTKKYYAELDAWVRLGEFYFSTQRPPDARETLAKAIRVLSKKTCVDLTNRFAQMEFKYGNLVKAKSMFESLLANYPKRLDIWKVYIEQLTKHDSIEQTRNVLSRMCALPMRFNKKIACYRKWVEFEKAHGDARSRAEIKRKVHEYFTKNSEEVDALK